MKHSVLTMAIAGLVSLGLIGPWIEPANGAEKDAAVRKAAGEKVTLTGPAVFKLQEVPAFGKQDEGGTRSSYRNPRGQYAVCSTRPSKQVKAYPKLKSKNPLYGSVVFDGSFVDPSLGTVFHFVLDESGEAMRAKPEKPGAAETGGSSLLKTLAKALTGEKTEAPPRPKPPEPIHYDRLYFDLNRDLDLTNDPLLQPAKQSPFEFSPVPSQRVFEDLAVPFDFGPGLGKRPVRLIPQISVYGPDRAYLQFIPTVARKGKIRLGKEQYSAFLSQSQIVSGRFDRPWVDLELSPTDGSAPRRRSLGSGLLGSMREVDGQLYTISATPLGDELTVQPYRGDYGILKVGPGGRTITKLGVMGELVSKDTLVAAGKQTLPPPDEYPREHRLPVGDYTPYYLGVDYGRLKLSVRALSRPLEEDGPRTPAVYAIQIRKDKPFVFELSGKPTVVFTGPRQHQTFKPGEEVKLEAVLTEPTLGVMIAGLSDTSRKVGEYRTSDGEKEYTVPEYARLDPTVVIRSSTGKQVAEGKMPFG